MEVIWTENFEYFPTTSEGGGGEIKLFPTTSEGGGGEMKKLFPTTGGGEICTPALSNVFFLLARRRRKILTFLERVYAGFL